MKANTVILSHSIVYNGGTVSLTAEIRKLRATVKPPKLDTLKVSGAAYIPGAAQAGKSEGVTTEVALAKVLEDMGRPDLATIAETVCRVSRVHMEWCDYLAALLTGSSAKQPSVPAPPEIQHLASLIEKAMPGKLKKTEKRKVEVTKLVEKLQELAEAAAQLAKGSVGDKKAFVRKVREAFMGIKALGEKLGIGGGEVVRMFEEIVTKRVKVPESKIDAKRLVEAFAKAVAKADTASEATKIFIAELRATAKRLPKKPGQVVKVSPPQLPKAEHKVYDRMSQLGLERLGGLIKPKKPS